MRVLAASCGSRAKADGLNSLRRHPGLDFKLGVHGIVRLATQEDTFRDEQDLAGIEGQVIVVDGEKVAGPPRGEFAHECILLVRPCNQARKDNRFLGSVPEFRKKEQGAAYGHEVVWSVCTSKLLNTGVTDLRGRKSSFDRLAHDSGRDQPIVAEIGSDERPARLAAEFGVHLVKMPKGLKFSIAPSNGLVSAVMADIALGSPAPRLEAMRTAPDPSSSRMQLGFKQGRCEAHRWRTVRQCQRPSVVLPRTPSNLGRRIGPRPGIPPQ